MIGTIAPPGVTRRLLGGVTTAVVPVGATAIPLDLTSDFSAESGGVLQIEDVGDLVYTGHEDDVVSLAEPLTVELEVDTPVHVLDAEGNVQEEWTVAVDLGDGEDDPETCYIGTDLQGDFQEGEEQVDQSVLVEERDGRYWVKARVDQQRKIDPDTVATPALTAHTTGTILVPDSTPTVVTGWAFWEQGGWTQALDSSFIVPRRGRYLVTFGARWVSNSGGRRVCWTRVHTVLGTSDQWQDSRPADGAAGFSTLAVTSVDVNAGDRIDCMVLQNTGASLELRSGSGNTVLTITRLGDL